LKQNDAKLSHEEATKRAQDLYLATKGRKAWLPRSHQGKPSNNGSRGGGTPHIWHGGSETYLFNTLEGIAGRRIPRTPALGCGVTDALKKKYLPNDGVFGSDYLPSRINWVVQSSGVDYLHLLIVSMEYLIARYGISARYMISVHDEVRYLVREEDKYRAAMALQVANAWTRALFCYNIGMDDLPQGVAFFSAVDVDHVFRKEVDMPCVTPSQPTPIPQGESVDIAQLLVKTDGGHLGVERDLAWPSCAAEAPEALDASMPPLFDLKARSHVDFLNAQASRSSSEAVRYLIDQAARERSEGGEGGERGERGERSDSAVLKGKRGRSR
jgi:DNA polymerase gamma 1